MMFLPFPSLEIEQLIATEEGITVLVSLTTKNGTCPDCLSTSSRVHSRYQRTLQDLPASGVSVQLKLHVRRFFCDTPSCSRKTFAQAIPEVTARYARKTLRLIESLRELGFALGGEAGARMAKVLKMACSADSFLRLIRKTSLTTHPTPTHLGVDDWAFCRNVSYGTILVDLHDHRVVDLLPDRSAKSLESWLASHPGVELISRDRSGDYATGASNGAPQAIQVADRFHLQKNLSETVERIFHRYRLALQQIVIAGSASSGRATTPIPRPERQAQKEQTRSKRMHRYEAVRQLYLQGMSLSEIARRFHMGRMTVQKFAYAEAYPETATYRIKAGMLRPYEAYVRQRWQQGCRNASQLYQEVVKMGYPGKRKQVARLVAHLRTQMKAGVMDFSAQPPALTPRAAVSLLMRRPENLTPEQEQALIQLCHIHPEIEELMQLVEGFLQMLRTLQGQQLENWMQRVQQSNIREMQNFVEKLRQDRDAVQAGLTLQWSNGVVEGHINRLKCLKRAMYGRAKFDLLRQRVLYRSPFLSSGSFHAMCG